MEVKISIIKSDERYSLDPRPFTIDDRFSQMPIALPKKEYDSYCGAMLEFYRWQSRLAEMYEEERLARRGVFMDQDLYND